MTFHISPARAEERNAALQLFFQHVDDDQRESRVQRALALVDQGGLPGDGLLVCRDGDACVGMLAALPLPGAGGMLWPPQVAPEAAGTEVADLLVLSATAWLRQLGAKFAQSILSGTEVDFVEPLLRHGFRQITALYYLQKDLENDIIQSAALGKCRFQTCAACDMTIFRATLMATYEHTLDVPELNNLRSAEEIVAGYQAVPSYSLDRWWLAWHDDRPAGVVICLEMPDAAGWELAYLGLVPELRRRGIGKTLTQMAIEEARAAGATRLILSVDGRNIPARRMYKALGFEEQERREVFLAVF